MEGSGALKALHAGLETRFPEEHEALVEAVNEQKAMTKVQTSLLEVLCREVDAMNERVDGLCSHTRRLGHIESDVAAISKSVQGVANGMDAVSSFISGLNEHLDDVQLVVEHKANEIRKAGRQEGNEIERLTSKCKSRGKTLKIRQWTLRD